MTRLEIVILLVTIFVSVTLLAFFLDKIFKTKVEKKSKEAKTEKPKEESKEVKEEAKEELKLEKEVATEKVPEVSLALQDELNEFKDYLKTRITPAQVTKAEKIKHSYDVPNFSRYGNFDFDDLTDDEFPYKKKQTQQGKYESLPDDVKMLLFTDFFDTKF